jgi:hypothetical protein
MSYENARDYSKKILNDAIEEVKKNPVEPSMKAPEGKTGKVLPEAISGLIDASQYDTETKESFRHLFTKLLGIEVVFPEKAPEPEGAVVVPGGVKPGMVVVYLDGKCDLKKGARYLVTSVDRDGDASVVNSNGVDPGLYLPEEVSATRLASSKEIDAFYADLSLSENKFLLFTA